MASTKINNAKDIIKELGLDLETKKIERIKQRIEYKQMELTDLQLQLARELDRAKNGSKKQHLNFLTGRNLWRD